MPEYLAPGVYVEEVSFRSKSIEGVPTSTTGFAGMTRYGPVHYPGGPSSTEPRLITSFTEFERVYGGLEVLHAPTDGDERLPYTAHAARAFFVNGGKRLYVSRVFTPRGPRRRRRLGRRLARHPGERHDRDLARALARRLRQRVGRDAGGAQQEHRVRERAPSAASCRSRARRRARSSRSSPAARRPPATIR